MSAKNLFVELHALVSHAPSNLNRDDLGAPKTAVFGGVRRLRISSQCLKRSWRAAPNSPFRAEFAVERERLGERTSRLGNAVLEQMGDEKLSELEGRGLNALLSSIGRGESSTEEKKKGDPDDDDLKAESTETAHLLYLSQDEQAAVVKFVKEERVVLAEIGALARSAEEAEKKAKAEVEKSAKSAPAQDAAPKRGRAKSAVTKAKDDPKRKEAAEKIDKLRERLKKHLVAYVPRSAVDVALFGRFLTQSEFREIDAAMQVAHALGTQKAEVEYDYFTAIDDRSGEAAAGHIGETELGASVFYKYAACDMALLRENLGPSEDEKKQAKKDAASQAKVDAHRANAREIAARALKAIAHAMARVVPTGKKNSTAPQNPADYLEVVIRRDAPVSLANAFLDPVRADRDSDVMHVSIKRLREHADTYDRMYGADSVVGRLVLSSRQQPTKEQGKPSTSALAERETRIVESLAALGSALEATLLRELPA
jgi:CRISPR system Cascade subunit CasC